MTNTRRQTKPASAETTARLAEKGRDVSHFFTNRGRMMPPIQRVNVDFTAPMLEGLDKRAEELNISRQAVIKTLIRQALDQHYLAIAATASHRQRKWPWSMATIVTPPGDNHHSVPVSIDTNLSALGPNFRIPAKEKQYAQSRKTKRIRS
jgi:hypothetical protein